MTIKISCPSCGTNFNLADDKAGLKVRCAECREVILVEDPEESAPARASSRSEVKRRSEIPAPPPSSRDRRRRDDEDEEDRPRRRRSRDEDEDEDDRRPRRFREEEKPAGGAPIGLIIGLLAGVFLLCGGGGVVVMLLMSSATTPDVNPNDPFEKMQAALQRDFEAQQKAMAKDQLQGKIQNPPGFQKPPDFGNPLGFKNPTDISRPAKNVPEAIALLGKPDRLPRTLGLTYLRTCNVEVGQMGPVNTALSPIINDRDFGEDVVMVGGRWRCACALDRLVALADARPFSNARAIECLANYDEDKAVEAIARQLGVAFVWRQSIEALKKSGKRGEKHLLKHMHSPNAGLARESQEALKSLNTPSEQKVAQAAEDLSSTDKAVKFAACQTLINSPVSEDHREKIVKSTGELITNPDGQLKREAIKAFAKYANGDNIEIIVRHLASNDPEVRREMRNLIVKHKDPSAIKPLLAGFGPEDRERGEIKKVLIAFGKNPDVELAMHAGLNLPITGLRHDAIEVLGEIGVSPTSVKYLQQLSKKVPGDAKLCMAAITKIQARMKEMK